MTLAIQNASLKEILTQIETKSDIRFSYTDDVVEPKKGITFSAQNEEIEILLKRLLTPLDLAYTRTGNTIGIIRKIQPSIQTKQISGTIQDEYGEPIIGANVVEKGTQNGTITNLDGEFTLEVSENAILRVSYVGYQDQEIRVAGKNKITVQLADNMQALDDVIVIGYGTVKKSNLTGAVASVKMEEIPQVGTTSVTDLLVGRIPGLSIRQSSAAPGGDYTMRIRGAASINAGNSPLYVVDGFPGGDINAIHPSDIESIEVLKDASATAIYGARAANGVILVNTKKGKKGALNINFRTNASIQKISKPYEMVGAREYMELSNEFFYDQWLYQNSIAPYGNTLPGSLDPSNTPKIAFSPDQIASARNVTDWFDEITRLGIINEESLSISGGAENVRYLFSLNHFGQKGVILASGLEKFTGRVNLEIDMAKWLTTGISASISQTENDKVQQAASPTAIGMIRDAMMYPQYLPVYDEEGNFTINPDHATVANPVSWKDVENKTSSYRSLINNFWNIRFTPEVDFRLNWGVDSRFARETGFYPKTHLSGKTLNTSASIKENRINNYLLDATLTYSKQLFSNHQLKAMAGYAYQKFNTETVTASNSDFLTDVFGVHNLAGGGDLTKSVESSKKITKYLSYFGRINYDIADKYLFTFTIRADGSDRFGANNRFGIFPSGAFAWRVSEEEFMKPIDVLSNLKLRLSVGQTGNAEISENTYGFYATGADYIWNNMLVSGVSENQLPNPNLKWETTTEYNIGLDWGFFNNRLSGTFEYYHKVISDLLDNRPVGSYYPVNKVADNIGKTQSKGFEIQINSVNIRNRTFEWSTNLNLYQYKDRWKERNPYSILSDYMEIHAPLHVKYGYLSDGLIQAGETVPHMPDAPAGSIKVKDINGYLRDANGDYILDADGKRQFSGEPDGVIDDADMVIIHKQAPDLIFGLGNNFRYKNFDLSFFFYGEVGRQVDNVTRMDFLRSDRFRYSDNVPVDTYKRWSAANPEGIYPSGHYTKYENNTDFWIEKADFIRLRNLTFGYTLPRIEKLGFLKNARFYIDMQNLFVITNYTGSDPETDSFSAYPNQRTFSLGIELSF
ncbi:MAG: TonB-dependent receptor [Tannerellaceae bacterium]|nr:TonB-dependent receptor [Tannerellaceae bacterium]